LEFEKKYTIQILKIINSIPGEYNISTLIKTNKKLKSYLILFVYFARFRFDNAYNGITFYSGIA
jgi:hypothetical protein